VEISPENFYLKMWYADAPSREYSEAKRIKRANLLGMIWRTPDGTHWAGLRFRYYNPEARHLLDPDHPDEFSYTYLKEKTPGGGKIDLLTAMFDRVFEGAARFHQSFHHGWACNCTGEELVQRITEGDIPDMQFVGKLSPEEVRDFAANMERVGKEVGDVGDLLKPA